MLGEKNRIADYQTGGRFYAAGVDFILDGERGRIYATAKIEGEKVLAADTPRDTVLVLGPFKAFNEDDLHEAEWIKWSVPDVVLPNRGTGVTEYWRSMADKARVGFSAAAYIPWDGKEPKEFKDAATEAFKSKGNKSVMLAAFDFECDADGEKDFLVYDGSWTPHVFYLNGEKTEGKGGKFRIKVKKGPNRMLLRWAWGFPWQPQALLLSVCDDGDVNKAVKFVKPKTNPRETVFESKGLSGEFTASGMVSVTLAGKKFIDGGLAAKDDKTKFSRAGETLSAENSLCKTTISADSIVLDGMAASCFDLVVPIDWFLGRKLAATAYSNRKLEAMLGDSFVKGTDFGACNDFVAEGLLSVHGDNCNVQQTFDRRQWRQQSYSIRIVTKEGPWKFVIKTL